jgi:hypothetical protein
MRDLIPKMRAALSSETPDIISQHYTPSQPRTSLILVGNLQNLSYTGIPRNMAYN